VSLKILIADDNETIRAALRKCVLTCNREGWAVCGEAADGVEAVEKTAQLKPDVVLMDITMPRMNGLDATRIIREKVPESEVVVLSQNPAAACEPLAIKAGARAYVEKSQITRCYALPSMP
jgi:DNA-binding NarL/FixJ family response regulator